MAYTTINKSSDFFNTKLYTGTGSSNAVTGVGFQPDLVWLKKRNAADNHYWFDAVRGATKYIRSNLTSAEATDSGSLSAFGSDGFTVVSEGDINANGATMASWNWKAGTGQGSSNTDGSINTAYTSANTTAGFSISTYTGTGSTATVGHGLGVAPAVVLIKVLSTSNVWSMYHKAAGATHYLQFDNSGATDNNTYWNDTAPTNSVFTIGTASGVNTSGASYVAYCWAEKPGFFHAGSYIGNGNSNGTSIYMGLKPSMFFLKADRDEAWYLWDNKRLGYNVDNNQLYPSLSDAEGTTDAVDILSTGVKIRYPSAGWNNSGTVNYYLAWGQSIVGTNNIPVTGN
jgi:hypothetical protein|tara:strand:+ start:937 stop:1962 length:1026 start_codon:yes stop_codon:yes gene_type:complete